VPHARSRTGVIMLLSPMWARRVLCIMPIAALVSLVWSWCGMQLVSVSTGEGKVRGTFSTETAIFVRPDDYTKFTASDVSTVWYICQTYAHDCAILGSLQPQQFCCNGFEVLIDCRIQYCI